MYCKKRELSRRQARPCNHFNTKESHIVPTETLLDAAQRTLKCIDTHPPPTDTTHTRARRAHGCQLTHPAPYPVNPEPAHAASMAPQKCFFFCLAMHSREPWPAAGIAGCRPLRRKPLGQQDCVEPPLPAKAPCAISRRRAGECARGQGILTRPPRCRQASPA